MPKLYNINTEDPPFDVVYIGRPSDFGNPFEVGVAGNRQQCVDAHRRWVLQQPDLIAQIKKQLRGKDLSCWCAPKACHGDTLLEIANADE